MFRGRLERWLSGLKHSLGKRESLETGTKGSNPFLSATLVGESVRVTDTASKPDGSFTGVAFDWYAYRIEEKPAGRWRSLLN